MNTLVAELPAVRRAWSHSLAVLLLLWLVILVIYRDTGAAMVGIWYRSETFAHAFVVPPISLWLIWRLRNELRSIIPQPIPWLALALAVLSLIWWLGDLVSVNAVTQLMLVCMLVVCVPAAAGWNVTRRLAFPLAFLFFSVPVGEFLTPWLMALTADFTVFALRLTGLPVYREGLQFVIPSGRWSVVEACSGIRYLMASFMVGTLFAYLNYQSLRRRLIFIGVSIAMPIVANWLRAYMIVMIGHLSDNRLATGVDHLIYGWVFFGVVIVAMFFVGARWAEAEPRPAAVLPGALLPSGSDQPMAWLRTFVFGALALSLPLALHWQVRLPPAGGMVPLSAPELASAGWTPTAVDPGLGWEPIYVAPRAQVRQVYEHDGKAVGLHIAYYREQDANSKLVTSVNMIVASQDRGWNQIRAGQTSAGVPARPGTVRAAELWHAAEDGSVDRRRKLIAWRFYWVDGRLTGRDIPAKLLLAWQRIRGGGDASAALIVYADGNDPGAVASMARFIDANSATIERQLREAASR